MRDEELITRLAARPLPALRELTLALHDPFDAAEPLERYIGELPALTKLTVQLYDSSGPIERYIYDSDDSEALKEISPEQRMQEVHESLTQAAVLARVRLTIKDETEW